MKSEPLKVERKKRNRRFSWHVLWLLIPIALVMNGFLIRSGFRKRGVYSIGRVLSTSRGAHQSYYAEYEYYENGRKYIREEQVAYGRVEVGGQYLVILDSTDPEEAFIIPEKKLEGNDTCRDWRSEPIDKELVSFWRF